MGRNRRNVSARSSAETPSQRKHDSQTPTTQSEDRDYGTLIVSRALLSTPRIRAEMGPWWERAERVSERLPQAVRHLRHRGHSKTDASGPDRVKRTNGGAPSR